MTSKRRSPRSSVSSSPVTNSAIPRTRRCGAPPPRPSSASGRPRRAGRRPDRSHTYVAATPWPQPISSTRSPGRRPSPATIPRPLDPPHARRGRPHVDDELVARRVEPDRRDLAQVEPEQVRRPGRALAAVDRPDPVRVGDLLRHPGELGVALPAGRVVGAAVEGEARVAPQVERLARLPHRPDPEVALDQLGLGAGDARGAVAADGGERLVDVGVEARADGLRERRRLGRERVPGGHGATVPRAAARVQQDVESDQDVGVADRLRELIDLVLGSLDEPGADGAALARRAHFSRDHLDRLLAAATGESPVALRRRLLLERAAWQLRSGGAAAAEAAAAAGYALARRVLARVRARLRDAAERVRRLGPTRRARRAQRRPLPPAGRPADPGRRRAGPPAATSPSGSSRTTSTARASCSRPPPRCPPPSSSARCGPASSRSGSRARRRARRRWPSGSCSRSRSGSRRSPARRARAGLRRRCCRASTARPSAFERVARRIRDRGAWDDAFVDALCEPPQSFTYGGVLAHVLSYGAVRREALASVLTDLGASVPTSGDPIEWEAAGGRAASPPRAR